MGRLTRWLRVVTLMAGTVGGVATVAAQTGTVPAKDAAEIRAALDGMQEGWNTHDMRKFVSYMTEDVEWVNIVGMWWRGKAEVYKAHEAFHQTIFKNRQ